ncbi:pentapeptide repeat-containing protein [Streptomyces coacervatus]|uniref:pentapeptide repeat-containing protein n=1 Tax=Streptomyces coacervatus TaxID=647381 RepID=UPI0023DCE811|nr:pentapeptide repeat-containing protein [Streptomyces coacervatus]MDF2267419.1 pentapeptide repeat-containing protein [Streptomyces coacervatus]
MGSRTTCLVHLNSAERDQYFASLHPNSALDLRGITLSQSLLTSIMDKLMAPGNSRPIFGKVDFSDVDFDGDVSFASAIFRSEANFSGAIFNGKADFGSVRFDDYAGFVGTVFGRETSFSSTVFKGDAHFGTAVFGEEGDRGPTGADGRGAWFGSATFLGYASFGLVDFNVQARFGLATFKGLADFDSTTFYADADFTEKAIFEGDANFTATVFHGDVNFTEVLFAKVTNFGPMVCAKRMTLSKAIFGRPVTVMIAGRDLVCRWTLWSSRAAIKLRYARVDFTQAVFEYPLSLSTERAPFSLPSGSEVNEALLANCGTATARIATLHGVDAAHLVLADVDLSQCLLTGTVHLDQVRLEGNCTFSVVPPTTGWPPRRFTPRQTLAEEHKWRASQPSAAPGWNGAIPGADDVGPRTLAPAYRQLRKSFEDSKNEPDAADFYYGEMEMRRKDRERLFAERSLLTIYWALSGYGLRATRALVWLVLAMTGTLLAMMFWGLPANTPNSESIGKITGKEVRLITSSPAPTNPTGPVLERISTKRFEASLRVVTNSVIFRSSNQDLTTTGTYAEMASRLSEPILLGFAILAVRGRIKR